MTPALNLFFYTITVFGFCYAVGHSKISLRPREILSRYPIGETFVEMAECPACLGFWLGLIAGTILPFITPIPVPTALSPFLFAFYTCGTGFLLGRLTGWIPE
jgi:hypothetical protein